MTKPAPASRAFPAGPDQTRTTREPSGVITTSRNTPSMLSAAAPGVVIVSRETGNDGGRNSTQVTLAPSTAVITTAVALKRATRRSIGRRGTLAAPMVVESGEPVVIAGSPASVSHLNSSSRSRAVCQRLSGSFARHFWTTRSTPRGASG